MPRKDRKRRLSEEERALWQQVAKTAIPLDRDRREFETTVENLPPEVRPQKQPAAPAREPASYRPKPRSEPPRTSVSHVLPVAERYRDAVPDMDRKRFRELMRGKKTPEARIDLHGMTADRAHYALRGFILDAHARGLRLVLVITGKGRARGEDAMTPHRAGVLRHAVPDWLHQPPLGPLILQVGTAHRRHGGEGAYYVYLRRKR